MKIAVVGSRDYPDLDGVRRFVDLLPEGATVVSGGARGVDNAAEARAIGRGLDVLSYRVQQITRDPDRFEVQFHRWFGGTYEGYVPVEEFDTFKDAAFFRNGLIVEEATEGVAAFWDGQSTGTANTIERAADTHRPLVLIKPPAVAA